MIGRHICGSSGFVVCNITLFCSDVSPNLHFTSSDLKLKDPDLDVTIYTITLRVVINSDIKIQNLQFQVCPEEVRCKIHEIPEQNTTYRWRHDRRTTNMYICSSIFMTHFTCYVLTTARRSNENEHPMETIQFLEYVCKVIIPTTLSYAYIGWSILLYFTKVTINSCHWFPNEKMWLELGYWSGINEWKHRTTSTRDIPTYNWHNVVRNVERQ